MKPFDPPAIIRTVEHEAEEQQLVQRAREALSNCNWTIGECASKWVQPYVPGRTDADFGELIGLSADQVRHRRTVWNRFGKTYSSTKLSWTHFREALNWDDAYECLDWASETDATVAQMKAWRSSRRGEEEPPKRVQTLPAQQDEGPSHSGATVKKRAAPPKDTASRGINRQTESPTERLQVPAKPEPLEDCWEGNEPAESGNAGDAPPPGFSVDRTILQIRSLMADVDQHAEQPEKEEVADELRQWELRFRPVKVSKTSGFKPPTVEEVRAYCRERGNQVDPQQFVDYYEMKGWMAGKVKMKNWQAAVRTWEGYDKKERANVKVDGRVRTETDWDIPVSEDYSGLADGN